MVMMTLLHRRRTRTQRSRKDNRVLTGCVDNLWYRGREWNAHLDRVQEISSQEWCVTVYGMTDHDFLTCFRVTKRDFPLMVEAVAWPDHKMSTSKNLYSTSPQLTALVILRRLASPCRWVDVMCLFRKHPSHLSEIFWEGLRHFVRTRKHLAFGTLHAGFISRRAEQYSAAIESKCNVLGRCLGFIDGTVLGIARPGNSSEQNAAYNGHKRKHALKYQTITSPDGLILHAYGPMEGRRHDWALYLRSGIEDQLDDVCFIDGVQYYIHGDSGYNRRITVDVPFQGANLPVAMRAANEATAAVRVTVEWTYMEVKLYWTTVDFKRKLRVGEAAVGLVYIGAILLHNIRGCMYRNQVSQYFRCDPPSLEEYLTHKDE